MEELVALMGDVKMSFAVVNPSWIDEDGDIRPEYAESFISMCQTFIKMNVLSTYGSPEPTENTAITETEQFISSIISELDKVTADLPPKNAKFVADMVTLRKQGKLSSITSSEKRVKYLTDLAKKYLPH